MNKTIALVLLIFISTMLNGQIETDSISFDRPEGWEHFMSDKPSIRYCNYKKCEGVVRDTFKTGKIKHICHYKSGMLHGEVTDFFSNGQIKSTGEFQDGKKVGLWKFFYENGNLETLCQYDKEIRTPILEIHLSKQGDTLGKTKLDDDFAIEYQFDFKKTGDTTFAFYKLEELESGKKYQYKDFYENGVLKEEGQLIIKPDLSQQKIQKWYNYDMYGVLTKIEIHKGRF